MTAWRVTVPNWLPCRTNELMSATPKKRHRLRRADDAMVATYCRMAEVPKATGPRIISLEITLAPKQRADRDCFWKSVLDSLVNCQALLDDRSDYCRTGEVTVIRGRERCTVIVIEEGVTP